MFFLDTEEALDIAPAPFSIGSLLKRDRHRLYENGLALNNSSTLTNGLARLYPLNKVAEIKNNTEIELAEGEAEFKLVSGKVAAYFDGNDSYSIEPINLGRDLTISFWIRVDPLQFSAFKQYVVLGRLGNDTVSLSVQLSGTGGGGILSPVTVLFRPLTVSHVVFSSSLYGTTFERGEWTNFTVSVKDSLARGYVNGLNDGTSATISNDFAIDANSRIGRRNNVYLSNASIRDIAFFTRGLYEPDIKKLCFYSDLFRPRVPDNLPIQSRNVPGGFSLPTSVTRPRRPGQKPTWPVEVDWTHPLAKGLQLCVTMDDGSFINLATGEKPTIGNIPPVLQGHKGRMGARGQNSHNCYCEYGNQKLIDLPASGNFTVFIQVVGHTYSTTNALVAWSGIDDFLLYPYDALHAQCRVFWRNVSGTFTEVLPDNAPLGVWLNYLFESRGDAEHRLRQNNVLIAADSNSRSGAGPFNAFRLFNWKDSAAAQSYDDFVSIVLIWDRALSLSEKISLNDDPYQFLIPKI